MPLYNFSAGPATLPHQVLQRIQTELYNWQNTGISVLEISHRSAEFLAMIQQAEADLRELLAVPQCYHVFFVQGGARAQNAMIPLNLLGAVDQQKYDAINMVVTGAWSQISAREAQKYHTVHLSACGCTQKQLEHSIQGELEMPITLLEKAQQQTQFFKIPEISEWSFSHNPAYLHLCSNETIDGIQFPNLDVFSILKQKLPKTCPIVVDMSSELFSRVFDITPFGVIYACAQKNFGIAGLTLLIVHEDLLTRTLPLCPSIFSWPQLAQQQSLVNTPPIFAIYVAGLIFQWTKQQGGVAALEMRNREKAQLLYQALDASDFYQTSVFPKHRSLMNIPFRLKKTELEALFLKEALAHQLYGLKGHNRVGGIRVSAYNVMPIQGIRALISFLQEFEHRYG